MLNRIADFFPEPIYFLGFLAVSIPTMAFIAFCAMIWDFNTRKD